MSGRNYDIIEIASIYDPMIVNINKEYPAQNEVLELPEIKAVYPSQYKNLQAYLERVKSAVIRVSEAFESGQISEDLISELHEITNDTMRKKFYEETEKLLAHLTCEPKMKSMHTHYLRSSPSFSLGLFDNIISELNIPPTQLNEIESKESGGLSNSRNH